MINWLFMLLVRLSLVISRPLVKFLESQKLIREFLRKGLGLLFKKHNIKL